MSSLVMMGSDPDYRAIMGFLSHHGFPNTIPLVDRRDEMYEFGLANCPQKSIAKFGYFRAGLSAHHALRQIYDWAFQGDKSAKKILDFASGYGRATRFLISDFPKENVWASDILPGAMEFQKSYLLAQTIISTTSPKDFNPGQTFDFIWVASLFTHLPKHTFLSWLEKLYDLLTPTGVLVFSTHDTHLMPAGAKMPRDGIFFQTLTEIPSLDTKDYGASIVTPEFVASSIRSTTGKTEFKRLPRALNFTQDLYVISKGVLPSTPFEFFHEPYGYMDHCDWVDDETFLVSGWAVDYNEKRKSPKVEIYLNDELVGMTEPSSNRPDIVEHSRQFVGGRAEEFLVSGWSLRIKAPERVKPFHDIIMAKAISTTGTTFSMRTATLNTILTIAKGE